MRSGSASSAYGMVWLGPFLLLIDCCHSGSSLLLRTLAQLGFSPLVYGLTWLGSPLSLLDIVHLDSPPLLHSLC